MVHGKTWGIRSCDFGTSPTFGGYFWTLEVVLCYVANEKESLVLALILSRCRLVSPFNCLYLASFILKDFYFWHGTLCVKIINREWRIERLSKYRQMTFKNVASINFWCYHRKMLRQTAHHIETRINQQQYWMNISKVADLQIFTMRISHLLILSMLS